MSEGERKGGRKKRKTKSSRRVVSFLLVWVISAVGYKCARLVGWLVGCGVWIRVCEDRSDVLFDLSAADHRRLYRAGKCAGPIRCLSDADGLF